MRAYNIKRKKAFSLTELLIVIIIIGVLAGITMLSMSSMDDKLKANEIVENLRMAKEATQSYYTKTGKWPDNNTKLNSTSFNGIIDKRLAEEYQVTLRNDDSGGKVKKGSVFVRCGKLNSLSEGVRKKLEEVAKDNNLWDTSAYNDENGKYYKATGSGSNSIHLPVELIY